MSASVADAPAAFAWDSADFRQRALQRLRAEPPPYVDPQGHPMGDHRLELGGRPFQPTSLPRPAAVLVAVVMYPDEPAVILTERAANLRSHSGQIAFPGGKMDEGDASPLETALRESEEEIGLERRHVQALGYLDAYLTTSNFIVIPSVALISPDVALAINEVEVAAAFEVPLGFLMDAANHELHAREWQGRSRQYYAMPFGERYIWGVTAGILRNMYERLYGS